MTCTATQQQAATALLLVNLGTPESPAPRDVYRYLIEFLTDERVIDLPWLQRQLLVRGFIVPFRYHRSAASYNAIWQQEGSPLLTYSVGLQQKLQARLGSSYSVELAMRYQKPSIEDVLERLSLSRWQKLVVLPLFPQYASATTGSVLQNVMEKVAKWPLIPEVRCIDQFATYPPFIEAIAARASTFDLSCYDKILFSFHGLPQRQITKNDPSGDCLRKEDCCQRLCQANGHCYSAQCYATARGVAEKLGLDESCYRICFQSRLGREPWLQPYTAEVIEELARKGAKKLLVFSPSFVADCLETIFEIGRECCEEFIKLGGEKLDLVPSLNDGEDWVEALAKLASY